MLNLRRCVVGVVAVFVVSGAASAQTPIAVTAATLVGTYSANELRGDLQFQGQVVRVTGRVDDIARTILGDPYIRLSAGRIDTPRGVTWTLASTAVEAAAQLENGQEVTLEGYVDGLLVDVQLSNCHVAVEAMAEAREARREAAAARAAAAAEAAAAAAAEEARCAEFGDELIPPRKIRDVPPSYPPVAQAARVQGVVILEAVVGGDGRVTEVKVLRSVPLLDDAAIAAVRQWVYTPGMRCGRPVPVIVTTNVSFQMR